MNDNTYHFIRAVWHGYPVATIKEMVKKVKDINEVLPEDTDLFPNHNAYMIRQRFYGNDSVTKYLRSIGGKRIKKTS